MMSLKEDTSVRDVVSMDTVKRLVKIMHLKVSIQVRHPPLKGYSSFHLFLFHETKTILTMQIVFLFILGDMERIINLLVV